MSNLTKQEKAKQLRYKKAALVRMNIDDINEELWRICEQCDDVRFFDEDTVLNALDGDEEELFEFKMAFGELSYKCEELSHLLQEEYVTEHFDDFFVGIIGNKYDTVGYDGYQEDYFSLTSFESELAQTESGKRLQRLSKSALISVAGQAFGIALAYLDVCQQYDYLKATFDILLGENNSLLRIVKDIERMYEGLIADGWFNERQRREA